tara:strand:+ start:801 stop:986 length:186 start_codon:yes stop_codon:yes gene_type:complete
MDMTHITQMAKLAFDALALSEKTKGFGADIIYGTLPSDQLGEEGLGNVPCHFFYCYKIHFD